VQFPADMDPECIPLCTAMNKLPGIRTFESCHGHGQQPMWIFFWAADMRSLRSFLKLVADSPWRVNATYATWGEGLYFCLEGPPQYADKLANKIETAIANPWG
jgi:hypothetical protein